GIVVRGESVRRRAIGDLRERAFDELIEDIVLAKNVEASQLAVAGYAQPTAHAPITLEHVVRRSAEVLLCSAPFRVRHRFDLANRRGSDRVVKLEKLVHVGFLASPQSFRNTVLLAFGVRAAIHALPSIGRELAA